jgi:hypothetical protein
MGQSHRRLMHIWPLLTNIAALSMHMGCAVAEMSSEFVIHGHWVARTKR